MGIATLTTSLRSGANVGPHLQDSADFWFGNTVGAGTTLIVSQAGVQPATLIGVSVDVILEYERTILNLRRELIHYKRLMAQKLPERSTEDEYSDLPNPTRMDSASINLVNSIFAARIERNATFTDFQEEEL